MNWNDLFPNTKPSTEGELVATVLTVSPAELPNSNIAQVSNKQQDVVVEELYPLNGLTCLLSCTKLDVKDYCCKNSNPKRLKF